MTTSQDGCWKSRYPGILFGFRSYEEKDFVTHVLYVPFIDIAFTKFV